MCRAHDKRPFYVQRMQIEEAPLCTDGDPMPGSACGGERREGGEGRRVLEERECHHCVWWGEGAQKRRTKPSRSSQVVRRGHKSKRILITANLQMRSQTDSHLLSKKLAAPQHHGQ